MALGMVLGRALRELTSISRPDARIFAAGFNSLSKWDPWSSQPLQRGFSAMPEAEDSHPEPVDPKLVMSISAKADPFKTYGYMVEKLSQGNRINMKCTGSPAVHAATKMITISRAKIKEHSILKGDDICVRMAFQPEAPTDRVSKFTMAVDRVKPEVLTESSEMEEFVIRPNARSRPKEIALMLSESIENDKNALGKAMGSVPVSIMMAGYAQMRKKLVAEGEYDLLCFPEYRKEDVRVKGEAAERMVMNFMFRRVPFDAAMDVDATIGAGEYGNSEGLKKPRANRRPEKRAEQKSQDVEAAMAGENATEKGDETEAAAASSNSGEVSVDQVESGSESDSDISSTENNDSESGKKE
ncbi:hypothetical protein BSKO_01140 [Bryopsis sp. KO-2023]|nr:hypothetical protein BSKO_01140 [Bryopsis sp. KO-2023]